MNKVSAAVPNDLAKARTHHSEEPLVLPSWKDPTVVTWQRQFIESFLAAHAVKLLGPHKITFTLPPGETLSRFVKEAGEICHLFLHQPLVAPDAWSKWEYRDSFHEMRTEPYTIILDGSPKGGANVSFPQVRSAFRREGRSIASTAEVLAGHVACLLATSLEGLSNRESKLIAELQSAKTGGFLLVSEYTAQSFFNGPVIRTAEDTLSYNSLVGIDLSDFGRDKASPSVSVVERLAR
jgi:hypothetical protein